MFLISWQNFAQFYLRSCFHFFQKSPDFHSGVKSEFNTRWLILQPRRQNWPNFHEWLDTSSGGESSKLLLYLDLFIQKQRQRQRQSGKTSSEFLPDLEPCTQRHRQKTKSKTKTQTKTIIKTREWLQWRQELKTFGLFGTSPQRHVPSLCLVLLICL